MPWLLIGVAACFVATILAARSLRRRAARRREFCRLCDLLGLENRADRASGFRDGIAYELRYERAPRQGETRTPCLSISVAGRSDLTFTLLRSGDDGARILRPQEGDLHTGDADFDREVRVSTEVAEASASFFAKAERRRAGRKLLALGARHVRLTRTGIEASWELGRTMEGLDSASLSSAVGYLVSLVRDRPGFHPPAPPERKARVRAGRGLVGIAPVLLVVTGSAALVYGIRRFPPVDLAALVLLALLAGAALLAIFMASAWMLLRGTRLSRRQLARGGLLALLGCVLSGAGLCMVVNGLGDSGAITVRTAGVIGKTRFCPLSCIAYGAKVDSWRPHRRYEWIPVPEEIYRRISPSGRIVVVTKPGRLKLEWLLEVSEL